MQIDKTLIEKFLNNQCTAEKASAVHQYLSQHPDILQQYYQHDWDTTDATRPLRPAHAAKMFEMISERARINKPTVLRYMPWIAAAAAVVITCSVWLLQPKQQPAITTAEITIDTPRVQQQVAQQWQQQQNTTRSNMKVKLPDGSIATLSPAAGIKYLATFDDNKRDVILEGEALFDVVKDKTRPFTVYSGNLSTTALGTSFRVTMLAAAVKVKLLTGKVVIKGWKKDVYLLPGQQMTYDVNSNLVKVSGNTKQLEEKVAVADPGLSFDNTPLQQVFNKLSQHYEIPIHYTATELNELSFTGAILPNDSLPVILQAVSRMNNLAMIPVADGFCIKKLIKE